MATSIAELITTLDHHTANKEVDPGDAARALHHIDRTLTTARESGVGGDLPPRCAGAVRRLGESCADAATAFAHQSGRAADLAGVIADAADTLRQELGDTDRWTVAVTLAPIARRCARAIISSGPYAEVPELAGVLDRVAELHQVATALPPDPARVRGLHAPIPTTMRQPGLSADAAVVDAVGSMVAEFRRRHRPAATVRELIAVCHVAASVANHLADGEPEIGAAWTHVRNTLTLYSDGIPLPPPDQPRSRILLQAVHVDATIRHAAMSGASAPTGRRDMAAEARPYLERLANACHAELGRITPTLMVLPGREPLSEQRVAEWLRHEPFRVTPRDLQPAVNALRHTGTAAAPTGPAIRPSMLVAI